MHNNSNEKRKKETTTTNRKTSNNNNNQCSVLFSAFQRSNSCSDEFRYVQNKNLHIEIGNRWSQISHDNKSKN